MARQPRPSSTRETRKTISRVGRCRDPTGRLQLVQKEPGGRRPQGATPGGSCLPKPEEGENRTQKVKFSERPLGGPRIDPARGMGNGSKNAPQAILAHPRGLLEPFDGKALRKVRTKARKRLSILVFVGSEAKKPAQRGQALASAQKWESPPMKGPTRSYKVLKEEFTV